MRIKNCVSGHHLVSPLSILIVSITTFCLALLDNPMNWTNQFNWNGVLDIGIISVYVISVLVGLFFGNVFWRNRESEKQLKIHFDLNKKLITAMFFVACFFQFAKFVNIGDIPLLGDPASRYKLTLGGFEDYPSRLLAPICAVFFLLYLNSKKIVYLMFVALGFSANLMLLQRQEVLNLVLACVIIYLFVRKVTISKVFTLFVVAFLALYLLIGVGAVIRFGADNLLNNSTIFLLPFYVLHADLTTAIIFGQSIVESLGGGSLKGLYAFGSYMSIFIPGFTEHGAELVRKEFTNKDTAQSIGVPFAYFVDFGYASLITLSFLKGFLLQYFYKKSLATKCLSDTVFYIILYLNALWSLRAGTIVVTPISIYILFFIVFSKNAVAVKGQLLLTDLIKIAFVSSLLLSFVALAIRI